MEQLKVEELSKRSKDNSDTSVERVMFLRVLEESWICLMRSDCYWRRRRSEMVCLALYFLARRRGRELRRGVWSDEEVLMISVKSF